MPVKTPRSPFLLLIVFISQFACSVLGGDQLTIESTAFPTETLIPAASVTHTPEPTITPTFTETSTLTPSITAPPTETETPSPASLSGTVYLSANPDQPYPTTIELRMKDSFTLIASGKTDSGGFYNITNIEPGVYELWVLINAEASMIPGCSDVLLPDSDWKLGMKFGEEKAMTLEEATLYFAILLSENLESSDLKSTGIYAVLSDVEFQSNSEIEQDVTLICK